MCNVDGAMVGGHTTTAFRKARVVSSVVTKEVANTERREKERTKIVRQHDRQCIGRRTPVQSTMPQMMLRVVLLLLVMMNQRVKELLLHPVRVVEVIQEREADYWLGVGTLLKMIGTTIIPLIKEVVLLVRAVTVVQLATRQPKRYTRFLSYF